MNTQRSRRAVTLIELLIAVSIMSMMIGALGAMARAVQLGAEYSEGHGLATQHARVAMERITRAVQQATANEWYPGAYHFEAQYGTWTFPDTLVVWRPEGTAAAPSGAPLLRELVIFCPNPSKPNELLEITAASTETASLESPQNATALKAQIEAIKNSASSKRVLLTPLLRTERVTGLSGGDRTLAAVRFETAITPTADQWLQYQSGNVDWDELPWVQGIYGRWTGMRQTRVRIELQLMPGEAWLTADADGQQAIPFLGAAALHYEMNR